MAQLSTNFLEQIAEHYLPLFNHQPSKVKFIFPSRRAILFFKHYLGQKAERPIFAPECLTVNELLLSLQDELEQAEEAELLFLLYQAYAEARAMEDIEPFEEFLYWGRIILSDFDTIDRYLAPVHGLLSNLADYRELEDDYSYLSEESRALILSYWERLGRKISTKGEEQETLREKFLAFYYSLLPTYQLFTERLLAMGIAYEGMIYKRVAQSMDSIADRLAEEGRHLVFVGLFDISPSEEKIFRTLYKRNLAEFCWDEQVQPLQPNTDNPQAPAHPCRLMYERIRTHLGQVKGAWCDPYTQRSYLPQSVTAISTSYAVGQVKALPELLSQLIPADQVDGSSPQLSTAIILANDGLLFPVIGSIPEHYTALNISLGYPLDRTPIAVFISSWTQLIEASTTGRYTSDRVLDLLSHQLLCQHYPLLEALSDRIHGGSLFYLSAEWLQDQYQQLQSRLEVPATERLPICQVLFSPHRVGVDFLTQLDALLEDIITHSQIEGSEDDEEEAEDQVSQEHSAEALIPLSLFDAEFILHFRSLIERLLGLLRVYNLQQIGTSTVLKLLEGLSSGITIPFQGNPLKGLQVMGLLESRLLHFPNLIYIGATDGDLPQSQSKISLIPHDLRRGYQLPQRSDEQAAATYRFYQSIAGVEHLTVLYSGTVSRYIMQLEYLYNVPVTHLTAEAKPEGQQAQALTASKNNSEIQQALAQYLSADPDAPALSPTAIITYLNCPLRFYYQTIRGIREWQEPEQLLTDNKFGDVFHEVISLLYKPYEDGKELPAHLYERYLKSPDALLPNVRGAYTHLYNPKHPSHLPISTPLQGLSELNSQLILQYLISQLQHDQSTPNLHYISGELKISGAYILTPQGRRVNLKGTIDRIDSLGSAHSPSPYIRILDYKTGKDKKQPIHSTERMLERISEHKAMVQTLIYCELLLSYGGKYARYQARDLHPGLLLMRQLSEKEGDYEVGYKLSKELSKELGRETLESYESIRGDFLHSLGRRLDELFDVDQPFVQCSSTDYCKTCPFRLSCGR